MASNNKSYEERIKKIKYSLAKKKNIVEGIKKGGKLEIVLKDKDIEFWRKEKGMQREMLDKLESISDKRKCLNNYAEVILSMIENEKYDKEGNTKPDYEASLEIKFKNSPKHYPQTLKSLNIRIKY